MTVSIAADFAALRPQRILGIKISTLGDAGLEASSDLSDGRWRLATRVPAWDTFNMYRNVLMDYPEEIAVSVDWQTGTVTTGGQEFTLKATAEVAGWLLRPNFRRSTTLAVAIDESTGTIVLDGDPGDETTVMIGREAIHLGTGTTTTTTSFAGCLRGALGSLPYPHGVEVDSDVEVFLAGAAPIFDMVVEVFTVPLIGGDYEDEETIWRGVLQRPTWDGTTGKIKVSADSIMDILARSLLFADLFRLTSYGNPDSNLFRGTGALPDSDVVAYSAGFKYPTLLWDGERSFVADITRQTLENILFFVPARDEHAVMALGGAPLPERDMENGRFAAFGTEITQLYTTNPDAPALNAAGDRLSTNAVILAMQLLTTTPYGFNGTWDLGLPNLGCGIPSLMFDTAEALALSREVETYAELGALYAPLDGKPVEALDFVQNKVLRPFALALVPVAGGKYTIRRLRDGAEDAVSIGQADVVGQPSLRMGAVPAVDRITVTWGQRPGVGTITDQIQDGYNSERAFAGQNTTLSLDAEGVGDVTLARFLGLEWTQRYHWSIPAVDLVTKRTMDLWPGDVVKLTHRVIPGRGGVRGVTAEVMVVSGRRYNLQDSTIEYELWWTSVQYNRVGRIGPSARVVSYASDVVTITTNAFKLSGGDPTSDGNVWLDLVTLAGSVPVLILDSDLRVRGTASVVAAATSQIELSGATVAPVANDVIVLADAATVGAEELARYAFMADASDLVDGDDPYDWTR